MTRVLLAALALVAMTAVAAAEPKTMADAEMNHVTAGLIDPGGINVGLGDISINPAVGPVNVITGVNTNVAASTAVATAVGVFGEQAAAAAQNAQQLSNTLGVGITSSLAQ
jgi:hypothetical protein